MISAVRVSSLVQKSFIGIHVAAYFKKNWNRNILDKLAAAAGYFQRNTRADPSNLKAV